MLCGGPFRSGPRGGDRACKVVDPRLRLDGLRRVPHRVELHGEGAFVLQTARGAGNDAEAFSGRYSGGVQCTLCGGIRGGILLQCGRTRGRVSAREVISDK